jgi:lysophospholipase L1-like esterase
MPRFTNPPFRHWPLFALLATSVVFCSIARASAAEPGQADSPFARWEKEIARMEARDAKAAPPQQAIVFVGSSSIRRWNLASSFPGLPVINRGFGGSQLADSVHFAPRIILPVHPRIVVLYAGDNDLQAGKTPATVVADYRQFVAVLHEALPETRIVYIAVKPSISRWKLIDKVRATNEAIRDIAAQDELQAFVDIDGPMLGADGKPRPALFQSDGLHLSDEGYALWAKLLLPHLKLK